MTNYLCTHPSFIGGMASGLDLGDTLTEFNWSISGEQADMIAVKSDWVAVGKDIFVAMAKVDATRKAK
ncbi:MAG: hypothetical protein ABSF52_14705 [Syntrophobacteraceae bacterium]|jgi:hypothetical protein